MSAKTSQEKQRLKYFLWRMIEKYQPECYFCGKPFVRNEVLPSRGVDQLTEHHIDGNHMNMSNDNCVLVHRRCHKAHHTKDNVNRR